MGKYLVFVLAVLLLGCVDADEGGYTTTAVRQREAQQQVSYIDESFAPGYESGEPWAGWDDSPERVKVRVSSGGDKYAHYFESLPAAYGWLEERYDDYDVIELLVANALTRGELLDARDAYFVWEPGGRETLPLVLAYPERRYAQQYILDHGDHYHLADWDYVDRGLRDWRDGHWVEWRDDFGLVRTAQVEHYDGRFWDGWYDAPDRVLLRAARDEALASYYFDSLPLALAFLDRDPRLELVDLQVASAGGPLRLLDARRASYVWAPALDDGLPVALAFATAGEARRYVARLGDGFSVLAWNELRPRVALWSERSWDDWRGNPEHNRGLARALESGRGRKVGLRDRDGGVVAGDRRVRERLADDDHRRKSKKGKAAKRDKDERAAGKSGRKAEREDRKAHQGGDRSRDKSARGSTDKGKGGGKVKRSKSGGERKARQHDKRAKDEPRSKAGKSGGESHKGSDRKSQAGKNKGGKRGAKDKGSGKGRH